MANENSGILDANALFGDLPGFMPAPPSSAPPPVLHEPMYGAYGDVVILAAPPPTHRRGHATTTARTRRDVDPMRARLIAIITCGSIALLATLGACFLYVTAPVAAPTAQHGAAPASHAAR